MIDLEELKNAAPKAERYKQYLAGNAYIPLQDMAIYEKAYKLIYG